MLLSDLGLSKQFESYITENDIDSSSLGRIIAEHKERYILKTTDKEYEAEILGNLRYTAQNRADFPAMGDWVTFMEFDTDKAVITSVLPRTSYLERQAVGKKGEKQLIATNIDYAFIVQAVDRDFSINRLERYITICNAGKVEPIIVLNKIDLISEEDLAELIAAVKERIKHTPVFAISNTNRDGIKQLEQSIEKHKTYCLLGSSGVGKSTLLNTLSGEDWAKTGDIGEKSNRGKHITTYRELRVLENGGVFVDNPGMREIGMTNSTFGLKETFENILEFAEECHYSDCTHTTEAGCAVIEAVENGDVDAAQYNNFLKMEREKRHFEATVAEKRKKDKDFGKMMKNYKKRNPKKVE